MTIPTRNELKKELVAQGFEVYRTLPDSVLLADRVRDNLIMDSGVAASTGDALAASIVLRAQGSDFPGESGEELFGRARELAKKLVTRGYVEVKTEVVTIRDPGDHQRCLDTWYEVTFKKNVADVPELVAELRALMSVEKTVAGTKRS